MKSNRFQQWIDALLKKGRLSEEEHSRMNDEERGLIAAAKLFIAGRYKNEPYRMEFKEDLRGKILQLASSRKKQKQKQKKTFWQAIHIKGLAGAGILAVSLAVVAFTLYQPGTGVPVIRPGSIGGVLIPAAQAHDNFTLEAETVDEFGVIAPDTDFLLTSKAKVSERDLRQHLTLRGVDDISLQTVRRGYEYRLDPQSDLEPGAVLRVELASIVEEDGAMKPYTYSWAFEVSSHFKILSSAPADQTNFVPLNNAVHLELSHSRTLDPSAYIEIAPEHPFTIQRGFRSIEIIPTEPWQADELYTVTVKSGFGIDPAFVPETGDGPWQLEENYVIRFTTGTESSDAGSEFTFESSALHTRPGEEAVLSGWGYRLPASTPMQVEVFTVNQADYVSLADRLAAMRQWVPSRIQNVLVDRIIDDYSLETFRSQESIALDGELYGGMMYRMNGIDRSGIYLVKASIAGESNLLFWSVSNVGGFFTLSQQKGYVWTVDVSRDRPLGGVTVSASGQNLGITNDQGLLELSAEQLAGLKHDETFLLSSNGQITMHPVRIWQDPSDQQPVYNSFFLVDQYLVHPDDTVRFWGMVRREGGEVENVRVELASYGLEGGAVIVNQQTLDMRDGGFFSGEMKLSNLREGYHSLELFEGENYVHSKALDVRNFAVPEISISMQSRYQRIDAGESNRLEITALRFDGEPAAFLELHLSGDYTSRITTDANGRASVNVPSRISECADYGCNNEYYWVEARPAGAASGESYGSTSWTVTQSFTRIESEWERQENSVILEAQALGLDYQTNDESYPPESEIATFPAAGVPFLVEVYEITAQRSELLSEYDAQTNETRYYYDFDRVERLIDSHRGLTDANGRLSVAIPVQQNANYRANVKVLDPLNRYDGSQEWINLVNLPSGRQYVEGETDEDFIAPETVSYEDYLDLGIEIEEQDEYRLGHSVTLTVELGAEDSVLPADVSAFFYAASPDLTDAIVSSSSSIEFVLREEHLPNVTLGAAVVWQGHLYIYEFFKPSLEISVPERRLNVEVIPSAEAYGIGDEAQADIIVRDADGNPVQAEVRVNVLDQAYLDLEAYQDAHNPFTDLYRHQYDRIYLETRTHRNVFPFADGGGGGGDGVRSNFAEQAYYEVLQTDANGRATVSFTLPDNITTWSVGAAAATAKGFAGSGEGELVVSQPLVIETIQSDSYLLADNIVISARARAAGLSEDAEIQYAFYGPIADREELDSLEDFPVASQTAAAALGQPADFAIEISETGRYAYAVRANVNGMQDTVIKRFEVIDGRLTTTVTETFDLSSTWQAPAPSQDTGRIDIRFGSAIGADAFSQLQSLCACGTRLDSVLAWQESRRLLGQYFAVETPGADLRLGNEYKAPQGGLARFPFGEADLRASSAVAPFLTEDAAAKAELIKYFRLQLRDDALPEEVVLALRGLAALSADGSYAQAKYMVSQAELSLAERLILADAFILHGDKVTARELWDTVAEAAIRVQDSQISFGEGLLPAEEQKQWAGLAALVAHELADTRWQNLWAYAEDEASFDLMVRLWQARLKAQPVSDMSFVVRLGEREQFVTLRGFENFGLSLTPEELSALSVLDVRGNVQAMYAYKVAGAPVSNLGGVTLNRVYLQDGRITQAVDPAKETVIRLTVRAQGADAYGQYLLEDHLPSGLTALTRGYSWNDTLSGCEWIPYRTDAHGAKASVSLSPRCPTVTITYRARAVANAGAFLAEGASLSSSENGSRLVSDSLILEMIP